MLTDEELESWREDIVDSMNDRCVVYRRSVEQDGSGQPVVTYTRQQDEIPCGLGFTKMSSQIRDNAIDVIDAKIRLPIDTEVDAGDRIEVVERYGVEVSLMFDVQGKPQPGLGVLMAHVRWAQ